MDFYPPQEKFPILYALTSFWNNAQAIVTTFRIKESNNGTLERITSTSTGGYQAAHGEFSKDGSTYVISHHNGGKISFFDCSSSTSQTTTTTTIEGILPKKPIMILDPPEMKPGTREVIKEGSWNIGLPSIHGTSYAPNGKYLVCVDPVQNAVFTYVVDKQGRPTSTTPICQIECTTNKRPHGYFARFLDHLIFKGPRPRRAVVHPTNGKYLYVLHEITNYINIYEIDENGIINPRSLQEISVIDDHLRSARWIGLALSNASEMIATDYGLIVSIRGVTVKDYLGRSESNIRILSYQEDGRRLIDAGTSTLNTNIPAAVRHFHYHNNKGIETLWVGINSSKVPIVQKYVATTRRSGKESHDDDNTNKRKFILKGEANVGMDVLCVQARI